jgi:hypothetical protein
MKKPQSQREQEACGAHVMLAAIVLALLFFEASGQFVMHIIAQADIWCRPLPSSTSLQVTPLTERAGVAMAAATSDDSMPSAAPLLPLRLLLLLPLLPCCALRCVHVGYSSWSLRLPSTMYGR